MSGYLDFNRTGFAPFDSVIDKIEEAGDAFHHTAEWCDDIEGGPSYSQQINELIADAYIEFQRLRAENASLRESVAAKDGEIASLREANILKNSDIASWVERDFANQNKIVTLTQQLAAIQLYSKGLLRTIELVKENASEPEVVYSLTKESLSAQAPDLSALDGYVRDAAVAEIYQDSNTLLPALRFTVGIGYFAKTAINNPIPLHAAIQANAEKKGE